MAEAFGEVRAIDGKGHCKFGECLCGLVEADRKSGQAPELRPQDRRRHVALAGADVLQPRSLVPRGLEVDVLDRALRLRVGQDGIDLGHGVVTGHTRDRPIRRQLLGELGDLLHDDPGIGSRSGQPLQILTGGRQPVGMVDTDATHPVVGDPPQNLPVGGLIDLGILHPQPGELGDGEEAAIVQIGRRQSIADEPVVLAEVDGGGCFVSLAGVGGDGVEAVSVAKPSALEREIARGHEVVGQDRDEDTPVGHGPIDVEPPGVGSGRPLPEELPPRIVLRRIGHSHVIGHDVDDQGDPGSSRRLSQFLQPFLPPSRRVHHAVVHDVVAVGGAPGGTKEGGEVERSHAQPGQIRHDRDGIVQGELL